jgi:hypothetical protein
MSSGAARRKGLRFAQGSPEFGAEGAERPDRCARRVGIQRTPPEFLEAVLDRRRHAEPRPRWAGGSGFRLVLAPFPLSPFRRTLPAAGVPPNAASHRGQSRAAVGSESDIRSGISAAIPVGSATGASESSTPAPNRCCPRKALAHLNAQAPEPEDPMQLSAIPGAAAWTTARLSRAAFGWCAVNAL